MGGPKQNSKRLQNLQFLPIHHLKYSTHLSARCAFEALGIMTQKWHYAIYFSYKSTKVTSDYILNYLKKVVGGATTQIYQNQMLKP